MKRKILLSALLILPRKGERFYALRHNCFDAVDEIYTACTRQACQSKEKG